MNISAIAITEAFTSSLWNNWIYLIVPCEIIEFIWLYIQTVKCPNIQFILA